MPISQEINFQSDSMTRMIADQLLPLLQARVFNRYFLKTLRRLEVPQ